LRTFFRQSASHEIKVQIPFLLIFTSLSISIIFFLFSTTRHKLFQSSYDLTLFDQWLWLISRDFDPISSITNWHVLSDHAAWSLYLFAPLYKIYASINWLFLSQAICLSFTAIPIWILSINSGINYRNTWIICLIWWMQPVVFNANINDFHPEVWSMPALVGSYLFSRHNKFLLWLLCLIFIIGCRDGMVLIVFGIFIENMIRRKWKYALAALTISLGWLFFIKTILFPYLASLNNYDVLITPSSGVISKYLDSFFDPLQLFSNVNYISGFEYLILISIAFLPFWRINALATLTGGFPLVFLNFIAENQSMRMLIHQYNLPLAAIGVVAVIDCIAINSSFKISWKYITWISICWFSLAKPYFYTGPYLSRLPLIKSINQALLLIPSDAKVLTTSYIAPHLSHRKYIDYPREVNIKQYLKEYNLLLLNPKDPGYLSTSNIQQSILDQANQNKWICNSYPNNLELCKKPN